MFKLNWLALVILLLFSPVIALAYGLLMLFGRAHRFKGTFPRTHRWFIHTLPTDQARCSDGSPYSIYLKRGTVNKLVVYFSGGGLAWDAYTAARPTTLRTMLFGGEGYYFGRVMTYLEIINGGILAPWDPRNPFNDWNCVFIPYATGDCHVGDNDYSYTDARGRQRVLHHHGARNVDAALDAALPIFGCPDEVLVAGESAGAIGCVAQAPNVARRLGCGHLTVYSDSGQMYTPRWPQILRENWRVEQPLAACVADGNLLLHWFRWLNREMDGRVTLLQSCSSHDGTLAAYESKLNGGDFTYDARELADFNARLCRVFSTLAGELPNYRFYLSEQGRNPRDGSTLHTAARYPWYYSRNAEGISVASWLDDAVNRGSLYHVGQGLLHGSRLPVQRSDADVR